MLRERVTDPVILANRRAVNSQGHKLTHRKLVELALMVPVTSDSLLTDFPDGGAHDRRVLLNQAASQLLRTKRSKALGHPNGKRNYTAQDRRNKGLPGGAQVHGRRPGTVARVPK